MTGAAAYRLTPGEMEASAVAVGCKLAVPHIGRGWAHESHAAEILVTNNATDTHWWQRLAGECTAVCFPLGRLRWKSTLQGQAVLYFGEDPAAFAAEFRRYGTVWSAAMRGPQ